MAGRNTNQKERTRTRPCRGRETTSKRKITVALMGEIGKAETAKKSRPKGGRAKPDPVKKETKKKHPPRARKQNPTKLPKADRSEKKSINLFYASNGMTIY